MKWINMEEELKEESLLQLWGKEKPNMLEKQLC